LQLVAKSLSFVCVAALVRVGRAGVWSISRSCWSCILTVRHGACTNHTTQNKEQRTKAKDHTLLWFLTPSSFVETATTHATAVSVTTIRRNQTTLSVEYT